MKKIIYILPIFVMLFHFKASGQDVTSVELSKSKSLWFNTSNAAGLNVIGLDNYNDLSFSYINNSGDYKFKQSGESESNFIFNTNGAIKVNGISLWGYFTYKDETLRGTEYNTMLFDPTKNNPFFVADTVVSDWKKRCYALGFKAALPLFVDGLNFGLSADYYTNTGAKQNDPRSVSYDYAIDVKPALTLSFGGVNTIGVNGIYENGYQRTYPTNSDSQNYQDVFVLTGLGNGYKAVVGGIGGLGTFYYKRNSVGGAFQYGREGALPLLLNLSYRYSVEDVFQTPSKPQRMGTVVESRLEGDLQLMKDNHKLTLRYSDINCDGIEYTQKINSDYEISQWEILAKYVRSNYSDRIISANYSLYSEEGDGYKWMFALDGAYIDSFDEYYMPNSTLKLTNFVANATYKYNFDICAKSRLLVGATAGYSHNLEGEYLYNGASADTKIVTDFFYNDFVYLSSSFYRAALSVNYQHEMSERAKLYVNGRADYYNAGNNGDRAYLSLSLGLLF